MNMQKLFNMPVTSTSSATIADIVGVHREVIEQYKKALKEKGRTLIFVPYSKELLN